MTACLGSTGSIHAKDLSAVPPCPPVRQRARWTARIKIAALDGDRGHPAEPVFRRLGPFARDLRPKNGSRLAFVACTSLGRNPRRSCGDHACADRHSLGRSRLCAHAHRRAVPSLRKYGLHRIAQQPSKWIRNEQDRRKQVRYSMQHQEEQVACPNSQPLRRLCLRSAPTDPTMDGVPKT